MYTKSWDLESSLNVAKSLDVYKRISIRQTDYECLYYIESEWATWGLPCLADSLTNTLLQLAFSSYLTWGKLGACDGKRSSYHTLALAGEGLLHSVADYFSKEKLLSCGQGLCVQ